MKMRYATTILTLVAVIAGTAYADGLSPAINLETEAEWNTALGSGAVRPMTAAEFTALTPGDPTDSPWDWTGDYSEPQLHAYGGGHTLDANEAGPDETLDAGLVMSWGDTVEGDYTAAWRFDYGVDPNIVGQTLTATICPPKILANGAQMTSVGFGFTDINNLTRTYTWNVGPAAIPLTNTIAWNQNWDVSIGAILAMPPIINGPDPAAAVDNATGLISVAPIFFDGGFDPTKAIFLDAYENGPQVAATIIPPGGLTAMPLWNWWGNVVVTPEPATMSLLALGGLAVLRRRRKQ
jgi:hypothetical protein